MTDYSLHREHPEVIKAIDADICRHCNDARRAEGSGLCEECGQCEGCGHAPECVTNKPVIPAPAPAPTPSTSAKTKDQPKGGK